MSTDNLKPGDVVTTKKTPTPMTVKHIDATGVVCVWFDGVEVRQALFSALELIIVDFEQAESIARGYGTSFQFAGDEAVVMVFAAHLVLAKRKHLLGASAEEIDQLRDVARECAFAVSAALCWGMAFDGSTHSMRAVKRGIDELKLRLDNAIAERDAARSELKKTVDIREDDTHG